METLVRGMGLMNAELLRTNCEVKTCSCNALAYRFAAGAAGKGPKAAGHVFLSEWQVAGKTPTRAASMIRHPVKKRVTVVFFYCKLDRTGHWALGTESVEECSTAASEHCSLEVLDYSVVPNPLLGCVLCVRMSADPELLCVIRNFCFQVTGNCRVVFITCKVCSLQNARWYICCCKPLKERAIIRCVMTVVLPIMYKICFTCNVYRLQKAQSYICCFKLLKDRVIGCVVTVWNVFGCAVSHQPLRALSQNLIMWVACLATSCNYYVCQSAEVLYGACYLSLSVLVLLLLFLTSPASAALLLLKLFVFEVVQLSQHL